MSTEDSIQLTVTRLSHEGRGISEYQGRTVFITGALPSETVVVSRLRKYRGIYETTATEVIEANEARVTPECPHFLVCGGCALQHWRYVDQLAHKQKTLLELLEHMGEGVTPQSVMPPLASPTPYHYRHKARLGVRYLEKKSELLMGFRERGSSKITRAQTCAILARPLSDRWEDLKALLLTLEAKAKIPQIEVAVGENTSALIFRILVSPTDEDTARLKDFGESHHMRVYWQPKGPDSLIRVDANDTEETLTYTLPSQGLAFEFYPMMFTQINVKMNDAMVQQALDWLDLNGDERILDLFCGLGNFTLPLAKKSQQVIGVEGDAKMAQWGYHNAKNNGITNVEFYDCDLFEVPFEGEWANQTYDVLFIDPPRSGAQAVVENIQQWAPNKILYVSCNPSTLARDAKTLQDKGYQLLKTGVMDMFSQTAHAEAMALFVKK